MFLLFLIFIVLPIAELYVIFKVGEVIGAPLTIAILILDSLLGAWLLRSQGRTVWNRFQPPREAGRAPHGEGVDGVLVIFGGAFLITPGFIPDIIGIPLLLPATRGLYRRFLVRRGTRFLGISFVPGRAGRRPPPSNGDFDVEGTAVDVDQPRLDP